MYSIQKSDMDLRKILHQNIVLSGGSTLFRGFGDRLLAEIKRLSPKDMKIRVSYKLNTISKRQLFISIQILFRSRHLKKGCIRHGLEDLF